ncbi:unnamed protein product [Alternaria alternata]
MWPLNETPRPISLLEDHVTRSERRVYEVERNTWADALREELNTLTLQNAPTLPPARVAPDTALPRTTNSSRIELAPEVSTANRGGTYAAVFGDGFKATTGKVGKSVVKHIEDVSKIAKDVPTAFKEAQMKLSLKRAKDKIRWLEKHNYLSGQERLLTQELVG